MDKIDREDYIGKEVIINKLDELVEEWNSHIEWHRRFFDKYNKYPKKEKIDENSPDEK